MQRADGRVSRGRLHRLLDSLAERRLITVVADAGSGKSTTVHDWLAEGARRAACLDLEPRHDDPRALLRDLVDASVPLCSDLPAALAPELATPPGTAPVDPELPAVLASALVAGWEQAADGPFVLVLDGLHLITSGATGGSGAAFVADLVRLCPRDVRIVAVSREPLPFGVERLDSDTDTRTGTVSQRALLFTAAETAQLFDAAGLPLGEREATAVTQACAGWPPALRLAVESALSLGVDGLVDRLTAAPAGAQYLARAVLSGLDPLSRRHLRSLDVLNGLSRTIGAMDPERERRLDELGARGLLVVADEQGWALTPLARYAQRLVDPVDDETRTRTLRVGLEVAREAGAGDEALAWATELGDTGAVRALLGTYGADLLNRGQHTALARAAEVVDAPSGDPTVDALLAQLYSRIGQVATAQRYVDVGSDSALPAATAWRVATGLWTNGDAPGAAAIARRAVESGGADDTDADIAQLLAVRATLAWSAGDGVASRRLTEQAMQHANAAVAAGGAGDTEAHAAVASAWVARALTAALEGDLEANQSAYQHALEAARQAGDLLTQQRVHTNRGSRFTEIGRYHDALTELVDAVRIGEAAGIRARTTLALNNRAEALLGLGRLQQALGIFDEVLAAWQAAGSPLVAHAMVGRAHVLARRGEGARAAAAYRAAIATAERTENGQVLVPALAGLARCVHADDPPAAHALVERALATPASLGYLPIMLAAGWIALRDDDRAAALDWARRTRAEAGRRQEPAALAEALVLEVLADPAAGSSDARLAEARAVWTELDNPMALAELDAVSAWMRDDAAAVGAARARLNTFGVHDSVTRVAGALAVLGEHGRASVALKTLGSFAVVRGQTSIPTSAWQSRKARDLVKVLAGRRGRSITRDALAAQLWPDSGREAVANRLSVALSTARTVLDPDRAFPPDHFIVADRDAVRLDLRHLSVDVEEFASLADAALTAAAADGDDAVALLERVLAAYPGDFCEEDPYEDWASAVREELRARQQQVLHTLTALLADSARPEAAVPWLVTLLGEDRYDEPAHLRLVTALRRAGRHGEARRAYRTYLRRMTEIDIEPAPFPTGSAP